MGLKIHTQSQILGGICFQKVRGEKGRKQKKTMRPTKSQILGGGCSQNWSKVALRIQTKSEILGGICLQKWSKIGTQKEASGIRLQG